MAHIDADSQDALESTSCVCRFSALFRRRLKAALGRWNLPCRALVQLDSHAQRAAECLEDGFHLMVCVDAAQIIDMQRHPSMIHEAAEEFDGEIDVERTNACTRERNVKLQSRPARKIDHHARQRFVERHVGMAVAANALAIANGLCHRLSQRDARVFHRVVVIDMKVAMRFDFKVEEAVTRDLVEHVVEKRHAGSELLLAGAVQVELHTDLRFAGVANDFRNAHGVSFETFKRFQCSASFRAAIICAFSSADPTVKRTQFANNGCILLTFLMKTRDVSRVSKTAAASGTRTSRKLPALGKTVAPGSALIASSRRVRSARSSAAWASSTSRWSSMKSAAACVSTLTLYGGRTLSNSVVHDALPA